MFRRTFTNLIALLVIAITPLLIADTGPKPTAAFEIEYQIEPIPNLVHAAMYYCDDPDCTSADPIERAGPQYFECTQYACNSMAYGYADEMYITIDFDDGISRTSNIFTKKHFNAEYLILVNRANLIVKETGGNNSGMFGGFGFIILLMICGALLILLVIVLAIILVVRRAHKRRRAAAASAAEGPLA